MPTDTIGEIIGRAPSAITGYYNNPEQSAETFRNRWLYTGNLGSIDDEGYLTIRGRKKDMIVSGGQNVYAGEVENVLLKHPAISDCAGIGLPDDMWGKRVTAVVIAKAGASINVHEVQAFCRKHMVSFSIPKQVILHNAPLPHTATGKVQKFLLVEEYSEKRYS